MGSEAVLIAKDAREVYELGKFAGTWLPVDWTRTDFATFEKRIIDAELGKNREFEAECDAPLGEESVPGSGLAAARGVAADIFPWLERVGWKVECVSDQDDWYEDHQDELQIVGNRYDARPVH